MHRVKSIAKKILFEAEMSAESLFDRMKIHLDARN